MQHTMYITYAMKETNFCVLLFLAFLTSLCITFDLKSENKIKQHYRIKRNTWSYDNNYNELLTRDDYKYDEMPLHFAPLNSHLDALNFHQSQSLRSRQYKKVTYPFF